jgi:hypothetical protein
MMSREEEKMEAINNINEEGDVEEDNNIIIQQNGNNENSEEVIIFPENGEEENDSVGEDIDQVRKYKISLILYRLFFSGNSAST